MSDSPAFRPATLAEGFAQLGIRALPGRGLSLQPGTFTVRCPRCEHRRHGHKSPSLHVGIDTDGQGARYTCHNAGDCEWNAPQAFRCLGAGHSRGGGGRAPRVYRRPPADHVRDPHPSVYAFFEGRGISRETVDACGVKAALVWMPQSGREETVIAYPFMRHTEVINYKYRSASKGFRQEKDAEKIVYGWNDILNQPTIILVEGENDKLALREAGIQHAASVPDGAPERIKAGDPDPADPKFSFLLSHPAFDQPDAGGCGRIILAVDADGPGQALEAELARRLGPERCWLVRWPEGCKDANDTLQKHGPEEVSACIDNAFAYPLSGLKEVYQVREDVLRLYRDGITGGVPLGWKAFDDPPDGDGVKLALRKGELMIITGTPGSGKSKFMNAVMVNTARMHSWTWGVCSLETRLKYLVPQLTSLVTRKPFFTGRTDRMPEDALINAMDWVGERFHFIEAEDGAPTFKQLFNHAQTLVRRYSIDALLIDPYTEIGKDRSGALRDTDLVDEFLTHMRAFARTRNILVAIVTHPVKQGGRDAPRVVGLYDAAGSAHWANKADIGLALYRDVTSPGMPVEVHMKKVRNQELGRMGSMAELTFQPAYQGYTDPRPGQVPPGQVTPVYAPPRQYREDADDAE